jgi:hypothetical protein
MNLNPDVAFGQPLHISKYTRDRAINKFLILLALFSLKMEARKMLRG